MNEDLNYWHVIQKILNNHGYPTYDQGIMMNFMTSCNDYQYIIKKNKNPILSSINDICLSSGCNLYLEEEEDTDTDDDLSDIAS